MTYQQLEDEVIAEFEEFLGKNTSDEESIADAMEKMKDFLRTALRRVAEEGARSGVVGKDYMWGDIQNQSLRGINAFFGEEIIKPNE